MSLILMKLGISAVLGMIIGLEREYRRKSVGLRTHLVICLTSCLLTIVSIEAAAYYSEFLGTRNADPMRLAAQIVSGVGFIGGGVILRRENDTVTGLTTAAMVWGSSGIGITVGAGFYREAIAGIVFMIVSVELAPLLIRWLGPKRFREREIRVRLTVKGSINEAISIIQEMDMQIINMRIKEVDLEQHRLDLRLGISHKKKITDVYEELRSIESVRNTEVDLLN